MFVKRCKFNIKKDISKLPTDLIYEIFNFFSSKDVTLFLTICKDIYYVINGRILDQRFKKQCKLYYKIRKCFLIHDNTINNCNLCNFIKRFGVSCEEENCINNNLKITIGCNNCIENCYDCGKGLCYNCFAENCCPHLNCDSVHCSMCTLYQCVLCEYSFCSHCLIDNKCETCISKLNK
jgi:hypothetical protein